MYLGEIDGLLKEQMAILSELEQLRKRVSELEIRYNDIDRIIKRR